MIFTLFLVFLPKSMANPNLGDPLIFSVRLGHKLHMKSKEMGANVKF